MIGRYRGMLRMMRQSKKNWPFVIFGDEYFPVNIFYVKGDTVEERQKYIYEFFKEYKFPDELVSKIINIIPENIFQIDCRGSMADDMVGGGYTQLKGFISLLPKLIDEKLNSKENCVYFQKMTGSKVEVNWFIGLLVEEESYISISDEFKVITLYYFDNRFKTIPKITKRIELLSTSTNKSGSLKLTEFGELIDKINKLKTNLEKEA